jgi:hypothetical protein
VGRPITSDAFPDRALELRFWMDKQLVAGRFSTRPGWVDRRGSWAEIPEVVKGTWQIRDVTLTLSLSSGPDIAIEVTKSTPTYAAGVDQSGCACELTLLHDRRFVLFAPPDRRKARPSWSTPSRAAAPSPPSPNTFIRSTPYR